MSNRVEGATTPRTSQVRLKRRVNIRSVERGCLDEREAVLRYHRPSAMTILGFSTTPRTRKRARLIRGHGPQVLEIALVADEHDDDVRIGVVAELLEPPRDIDVRRVLGDVVDEECTDGATVVPGMDEPRSERPAKEVLGDGHRATYAAVMAR